MTRPPGKRGGGGVSPTRTQPKPPRKDPPPAPKKAPPVAPKKSAA